MKGIINIYVAWTTGRKRMGSRVTIWTSIWHLVSQSIGIARMQNKLCDVTKCLTTVAAGYFPAEIRRRSLKLGRCSRFYCSPSRSKFLMEFAFSSWHDALTCLLLRARRHKREKIVQMGRLSEWRCAVDQTTSLWSWWERRMQKRQYCTLGTVFSPVPSEGRTVQGMHCEDLSEKYPTYTKHLCLWCPLQWRETSRSFSVPARFV